MNIESISAAISAVVAVIAVVISVVTLRQNNKMIYEANKPIIEMYIHGIDVHSTHKYLVIKNFGKTSAKIQSLSFSKDLDAYNNDTRLKSLIGTGIAPNQSFVTIYDKSFNDRLTATISYTSEVSKHEEFHEFQLDFGQLNSLRYSHVSTPDLSDEAKAIINGVEAIIKNFN